MHGPDGVDYPNITTYLEVEEYKRLVYDHGAIEERRHLFRVIGFSMRIQNLDTACFKVLNATLPNGTFAYTGKIHFQRVLDTWSLDWEISAGQYVGLGILRGSHLYVSCGLQRAGLGILLMEKDQILWSNPEMAGVLGTGEVLSRSSEGNLITAQIKLLLPNQKDYADWTLELKRNGATHIAQFSYMGVGAFQGLALPIADGFVIGWYSDLSQLALLDYFADNQNQDRLLANWALGSFSTLGTEVLELNSEPVP